jgi:ABC-type transporter Mla subunit MlaD
VDIEVRIQTRYRDRVYRNSTIVAVNPTILTEALLEVGPPAHGAAPGEPVENGDRLRGIDPAEIDHFLANLYVSIEAVLRESRELEPDWDPFQKSVGEVSNKISFLLPSDQLLRIGLHAAEARLLVSKLQDKLQESGASRAIPDLDALIKTADPLMVALAELAQQLELLSGRAHDVASAVGPRRQELEQALSQLKTAAALSGRAELDAQALLNGFLAGRGTLGGFNSDIQIFDELKEIHRILKHQGWRVLIKSRDPGQRNVR